MYQITLTLYLKHLYYSLNIIRIKQSFKTYVYFTFITFILDLRTFMKLQKTEAFKKYFFFFYKLQKLILSQIAVLVYNIYIVSNRN